MLKYNQGTVVLLYFFSFSTHPYLKVTVCLLPFQPSSSWKWTAKQQSQLWTAKGKKNSAFILQVLLKYRTAKYERQNRANTLDLNLWEMQHTKEKKSKNILTLYILSSNFTLKYLSRDYKQSKSLQIQSYTIQQGRYRQRRREALEQEEIMFVWYTELDIGKKYRKFA